jgi:hypothetical protein
MPDEDFVDRQELLKARENLQLQLERVANPAMGRDRNPQLVARLRAMIKDIDDLLADDGAK